MRIEDFNRLETYYAINSTFPIAEDEIILDVFRFFKGRDMILEATDFVDRNQNNRDIMNEEK